MKATYGASQNCMLPRKEIVSMHVAIDNANDCFVSQTTLHWLVPIVAISIDQNWGLAVLLSALVTHNPLSFVQT